MMEEGLLMVRVWMTVDSEWPSVSVRYATTEGFSSSGRNLGNAHNLRMCVCVC